MEQHWQVTDERGQRKYLTQAEWQRFVDVAAQLGSPATWFCLLIAFTGCRLSEACCFHASQLEGNLVRLKTLKRRKTVFRQVPIPPALADALTRAASWKIHRVTGYRWVRRAMRLAGIVGPQASPKGLRHALGMKAVAADIPVPLISRWLGHASTKTTAIYLEAVGQEERAFMARLW